MKQFQKMAAMLVMVLTLSMILTACGGADVATPMAQGGNAAATAIEGSGTTVAGAATAVDSTAATMVSDGGTAVVAGATEVATNVSGAMGMDCGNAKAKVGLVTDVGKVDDKSFNQSAWEGVQAAAKDCGYEVRYIETIDPKDYATNLQKFVDQKYDIIVTVGFLMAEATTSAATKNPSIKFIGVDQFIDESKTFPSNYAGLIFNEDQAGYLAGMLAAQVSKSGKIGAVLGTDNVPPVYRFGAGYEAGAKSVKPDIKVSLVYHEDTNAFNDPAWGETTAGTMIDDDGIDVIFGCGGKTGNGALEGVAKRSTADKPIYAIGVDTDQYLTLPAAQKVLLTSATKDLSKGTQGLVKQAAAGSLKGGNNFGGVSLAPYHDLASVVTPEMQAKIDAASKGFADGSLKTGVAPVKPSSY